jgi:type VI secretion system protein ImpA
MSAVPADDIQLLVAPVAGAQPAGADLRYQPVFDEIKAARRAAEEDPGELAPWRKVADLATRASARSKDLQLGIWLLEAFARIDGFRGATAGLTVVRRLLDDFWDTVYPQLDPDEPDPLEYRRALLHWINDRLPSVLKAVPLTGPRMQYGLTHYEVTLKTGAEKDALMAQGWPGADQFAQAVEATPTPHLQQVLEQLDGCAAELAALQAVVDRRFEPASGGARAGHADAVSFVQLKEALGSAQWIVTSALQRRLPAAGVAPGTAAPGADGDAGARGAVAASGGADNGWSEALSLTKDSRVDGLRLIQAQLAAAVSGRDRFLRQLQLAELSLEAGVYSLAYPVFDELARAVDDRRLEEWEERALVVRVFRGLARCCSLLKTVSQAAASRESEAVDRLNQLEASQTAS